MTYLIHLATNFYDKDDSCLGFVADPVCVLCDNEDDAKEAIEAYIFQHLNEPVLNNHPEHEHDIWRDKDGHKEMCIYSIDVIPQEDFEVLRKYLPVVSK